MANRTHEDQQEKYANKCTPWKHAPCVRNCSHHKEHKNTSICVVLVAVDLQWTLVFPSMSVAKLSLHVHTHNEEVALATKRGALTDMAHLRS